MNSKYQETMDSCDRVCPYCEHSYQVESEDYSEEERVEKCRECGMKYHAREVVSVEHYAVPDCELNCESHQWALDRYSGRDFCSVCDKLKSIEREEN